MLLLLVSLGTVALLSMKVVRAASAQMELGATQLEATSELSNLFRRAEMHLDRFIKQQYASELHSLLHQF